MSGSDAILRWWQLAGLTSATSCLPPEALTADGKEGEEGAPLSPNLWAGGWQAAWRVRHQAVGTSEAAALAVVPGCRPVARRVMTAKVLMNNWPRTPLSHALQVATGRQLPQNAGNRLKGWQQKADPRKDVAIAAASGALAEVWEDLYVGRMYEALKIAHARFVQEQSVSAFDIDAEEVFPDAWRAVVAGEQVAFPFTVPSVLVQRLGLLQVQSVVQQLMLQAPEMSFNCAFSFAVSTGQQHIGSNIGGYRASEPLNWERVERVLPFVMATMADMAGPPGMHVLTLARTGEELLSSTSYFRVGEGEVVSDIPLLFAHGTYHWREKSGWMARRLVFGESGRETLIVFVSP